MAAPSVLPEVPVNHTDFISYVSSHPSQPLLELLEPFKRYDAKLREVFAQEPTHSALGDPHLNITPVFNGQEKDVKIRARDLESESVEEKERYVMPLSDENRRPDGSPAIIQDISEFKQNFALFCESSLVDLDWTNVVAAGSSVVTCLLPVPDKYKKSKRALRTYYHETIAPASDVDLFLYGLSEEEAVKKIIDIERRIKDSILTETTTIRTKNTITIASQYPTRHIQIVLRIYKSVAEILTGFDVDCSCAAYDGKQVYAAPRALAAYMSQTNTVDLTRRSPSYENRLSKYSHRGFEVYWPDLVRSRIDPTIYERNFGRTLGLARLLVLERLPTKSEREAYMDERRRERGRPAINRYNDFSNMGNIKDRYEDEVAEWVDQEDVSDYHTFTIPYGPKYHAKRIEKLLYTKDLLLNAEWNKPKEREVNLHRHPAFFGYAEDVIHDCCGFCPKPVTPEEHDAAEEEAKIYVSGEIQFLKDDPGRQAIGSFHPLTDDDWTEMAYVGNTARLCQAIIDDDLEHVEDWLSQEGSDPNCRDYTGRTPLHLAVTSSTPEIVRTLINHGARLVARIADGRTALHLAAARGNVEIVKMILEKSEENEEEESKKEDARKQARAAARADKTEPDQVKVEETSDDDLEMIDQEDSDVDMLSTTTGSFVKLKEEEKKTDDDGVPEDDDDEPDVYDVNVLAWDTQCSPLHLAILNGHTEVVKELVQTFGADVLLPIKLLNSYDKSPRGAVLTLVLALCLPLEKAKAMTQTLLELGASSAQADMRQTTALHYVSGTQPEVLETLVQYDEPAAKRAINHLAVTGSTWNPSAQSPLISTIIKGDGLAALKLLSIGADPNIEFKDWMKSIEAQHEHVSSRDSKSNQQDYVKDVEQPVVLAVQAELPDLVLELLERGASPNTLLRGTQQALIDDWYTRYNPMHSLLDVVESKIKDLKEYKDQKAPEEPNYKLKEGVDYMAGIDPMSYKGFVASMHLKSARRSDKQSKESYEKSLKSWKERKGVAEKLEAIKTLTTKFEEVKQRLLEKDAKTFNELYPDKAVRKDNDQSNNYNQNKQKDFGIEFDFQIHNLTDESREAYLKLFQAAWDGDLDTIKSLTLAPWGPKGDQIPLTIAVNDRDDQSPLSIAVLRGHRDLARAIVEICFAQYHPDDKKDENARYRLGNAPEDYDDDSCMDSDMDSDVDEDMDSDAEIDNEVPVYKSLIDDKFTVENIGEVETQVKSKTSPLSFISWRHTAGQYKEIFEPDRVLTYGLDNRKIELGNSNTLTSWAIITNDKTLFSFMLDLKLEWIDRLADKSKEPSGPPSFGSSDYGLAIEYSRLDILAEMIKHGGAGMNLESLVKKSGVKYQEKPKFYQGLSVHGKKRSDWVSAARGERLHRVADQSPPLLQAAYDGNLASVEWFMSDAPARHYQDFAEAYKQNKLIDHLNTKAGGFDTVLMKWLGARRHLALHCAVMAKPTNETTKLIEYLLKVMPESLETKSKSGLTPLALAFSLRRLEAAKVLIAAGADQTARDGQGANILHLLLCSYRNVCHDKKGLQDYLDLIDKRLVPSLLTERSSHHPGSLTPFARWMNHAAEDKEVIRIILDFAKPHDNKHLEMLAGSGDTPIHIAVKSRKEEWLKIMLEYRPDLLYRENSVGRTPYELAEDAYIASCSSDAPNIARHSSVTSIVHKSNDTFDKDYKPTTTASTESVWRLCEQFTKEHPGKRRLVSLLDANEVAKRLANRHANNVHNRNRAADNDSDAGSDDGNTDDNNDEVSKWY